MTQITNITLIQDVKIGDVFQDEIINDVHTVKKVYDIVFTPTGLISILYCVTYTNTNVTAFSINSWCHAVKPASTFFAKNQHNMTVRG